MSSSVLRGRGWLLIMVTLGPLCSCATGSKDIPSEAFALTYAVAQSAYGEVIITGETELPDGSLIQAVVSKALTPEDALDQAILRGSTTEGRTSAPVRDRKFTIDLSQPVAYTCGPHAPCGPWPAATYLLVMDAKTPVSALLGGNSSVFDDPRYLAQTHGPSGFAGLEVARRLPLKAVNVCLDATGAVKRGGECASNT